MEQEERKELQKGMRNLHDEYTEAFRGRNRSRVYIDFRLDIPQTIIQIVEDAATDVIENNPRFKGKRIYRVVCDGFLRTEVLWEEEDESISNPVR